MNQVLGINIKKIRLLCLNVVVLLQRALSPCKRNLPLCQGGFHRRGGTQGCLPFWATQGCLLLWNAEIRPISQKIQVSKQDQHVKYCLWCIKSFSLSSIEMLELINSLSYKCQRSDEKTWNHIKSGHISQGHQEVHYLQSSQRS